MHAQDDRYANFFLFTEQEVEMLCKAQRHVRSLSEIWLIITISFLKMNIATLQPHYDGYTARSSNGPIKLYNPLSVIKALAQNCVSNFWVETGTAIGIISWLDLMDLTGGYTPLSQQLWRANADFRSKLDILLTQKEVELIVDDRVNFLTYHCFHLECGLFAS